MKKGCDISACQSLVTDADFQAFRDAGGEFVMHRFVVGNEKSIDACALENLRRAKLHGFVTSPYCFVYPLPHLDPRVQAEHFATLLDGFGTNVGELPPMDDLEWPPRETRLKDGTTENTWAKYGCSAPQIRDWDIRFHERVKELTGVAWLLYSYQYFLDCIEAWRSPELTSRILNLANYKFSGRFPSEVEARTIKPPRGFTENTFVQCDGDGGMRFKSGKDADFDVFLGDDALWQKLLGQSSTQVPIDQAIDPTAVHAATSGLIVDDAIAEYRRTRIDAMFDSDPTLKVVSVQIVDDSGT